MTPLPKRLGHIWIGPKPAPVDWMRTWPEKHPDWEYTVYDNDFLTGYPFRLRHLIDEYFWRGLYAGVQDMMRYEILYQFGGFMADADAICLHPVDELLTVPCAYTVYDRPEGHRFRGVCPILACAPGNAFLKKVIDHLATRDPWELRKAEVSTGNRFLMSMIRLLQPSPEELQIWPTHYFIPWLKSDPSDYYKGPDRVYAEQKWGTSTFAYNRAGGPNEEIRTDEEIAEKRTHLLDRLVSGVGRSRFPASFDAPKHIEHAEKHIALARGLKKDEAWQARLLSLNTALEAATKPEDPRFHGMHFYRHMQNQPLTESGLRSRSVNIRDHLIGWLGGARRALLVGIDTGHLPLSALHISPELKITALDPCRWRDEKDKNPPDPRRYVPTAAGWLCEEFGDRFTITLGKELRHFLDEEWWSVHEDDFDLVMIPAVTVRSLRVIEIISRRVKPGTLFVCASADDRSGYEQADRLMLQRMAYLPVERKDFGRTRGSFSVVYARSK
ncbi:MAG: glycosyltransferase [Pseudomonadota bacterium]